MERRLPVCEVTANGQALTTGELVGYLREALEPPAPAPVVIMGDASEA